MTPRCGRSSLRHSPPGREYFLLRRLKGQTEARLHDKLPWGWGPHQPTEESAADPIEARSAPGAGRRRSSSPPHRPHLCGPHQRDHRRGQRLPHRPGLPAGDRRRGHRSGDRKDVRQLGGPGGPAGGLPRLETWSQIVAQGSFSRGLL